MCGRVVYKREISNYFSALSSMMLPPEKGELFISSKACEKKGVLD